jgi:transposase
MLYSFVLALQDAFLLLNQHINKRQKQHRRRRRRRRRRHRHHHHITTAAAITFLMSPKLIFSLHFYLKIASQLDKHNP